MYTVSIGRRSFELPLCEDTMTLVIGYMHFQFNHRRMTVKLDDNHKYIFIGILNIAGTCAQTIIKKSNLAVQHSIFRQCLLNCKQQSFSSLSLQFNSGL